MVNQKCSKVRDQMTKTHFTNQTEITHVQLEMFVFYQSNTYEIVKEMSHTSSKKPD